MTAREYLKQAVLMDATIGRKIDRLGDLDAQLTRSTAVLSMTPGAGHNDRLFEERMARFLALREEINRDIDRLVDLKEEIHRVIDALPEEKYRYVLEEHYLNRISFGQIADVLGYHPRSVKKIEERAIRLLKIPSEGTKGHRKA